MAFRLVVVSPPGPHGRGEAPVHLVQDRAGLDALSERLAGEPAIGLDTEFHSEKRYRPELLLVQIALGSGEAWIVDPLAVDPLPLGRALSGPDWILHGAETDVQLIHAATGASPRVLWDTQVMAGFLGGGYPAALGAICPQVLGRPIEKGPAMSDWSVRPLSQAQLGYAAEDARVVFDLFSVLAGQLDRTRATAWAREAGAELVRDALAPPDPDEGWRRLAIAPRLDEPTRKALHALSTWRERTARARDCPLFHVLHDGFLLDLARRRPGTPSELAENRRMPSGLVKKHGQEIVEVLRSAARNTEPAPAAPTAEQITMARLLAIWAETFEARTGIAASLSMPQHLGRRVAAQGPEEVQGWRTAAFGPEVRALLDGELALVARAGRVEAVRR